MPRTIGVGATRAAIGTWLAVDPASASIGRRVGWALDASTASDEVVIAAFDEIAARMGSAHRIVIEPPERDNADFFSDSEIVWEMQRGSRRTPPNASTVREAVSSLIGKLERVDARALERACSNVLPERLADTAPRPRCPSCGSRRITFSPVFEITEVTCAACGRHEHSS